MIMLLITMTMTSRCWSHKETIDGITGRSCLRKAINVITEWVTSSGASEGRTAIKRIFGATDSRRTLSLKSPEIFNKSIKFLLRKAQKVTSRKCLQYKIHSIYRHHISCLSGLCWALQGRKFVEWPKFWNRWTNKQANSEWVMRVHNNKKGCTTTKKEKSMFFLVTFTP